MEAGSATANAEQQRDLAEQALAHLRELSDFERDAGLRVGEVLRRNPEPAPGFAQAWTDLMHEHRAATAALCRLATNVWLQADDACTGRATIAWGPDGRVAQMRLKAK